VQTHQGSDIGETGEKWRGCPVNKDGGVGGGGGRTINVGPPSKRESRGVGQGGKRGVEGGSGLTSLGKNNFRMRWYSMWKERNGRGRGGKSSYQGSRSGTENERVTLREIRRSRGKSKSGCDKQRGWGGEVQGVQGAFREKIIEGGAKRGVAQGQECRGVRSGALCRKKKQKKGDERMPGRRGWA